MSARPLVERRIPLDAAAAALEAQPARRTTGRTAVSIDG
jgi:hypothetical protein